MKSPDNNKLLILSLLRENLKNPQPQVVGIERIAGELQMSVRETRQLLLQMDEAGIIKSSPEGHYSLITMEGLCWLTMRQSETRV